MRRTVLLLGAVVPAVLGLVLVGPAHAAGSGGSSPTARVAPNTVSGAAIVTTALRYLGYPYTTVGNSPEEGFSCIGFVSYVYGVNGIPLPDDLWDAQAYAPAVSFANLLPGDILFFQNTVWPGLSHTAIYLGSGMFVHAAWYNRGVIVSSFTDDPVDGDYWMSKYLGAERPWEGPAGSAPLPSAWTTGQGAIVTWQILNLRSKPTTKSTVRQVLTAGTMLSVVRQTGNWYSVRLPAGAQGWVIGDGIRIIGAAAPAVTPGSGTPLPISISDTATVTVTALNVRSGPGLTHDVVAVLKRGQKVTVLGRKGDWVQVRLAGGTAGWVMGTFLKGARHLYGTLTAPLRVHKTPAITGTVIAIAPAHTRVEILHKHGAWLNIRLPTKQTGYVFGGYVQAVH